MVGVRQPQEEGHGDGGAVAGVRLQRHDQVQPSLLFLSPSRALWAHRLASHERGLARFSVSFASFWQIGAGKDALSRPTHQFPCTACATAVNQRSWAVRGRADVAVEAVGRGKEFVFFQSHPAMSFGDQNTTNEFYQKIVCHMMANSLHIVAERTQRWKCPTYREGAARAAAGRVPTRTCS